MTVDLELGARVAADGVRFRVWAPRARELAVKIGGLVTPLARGAGDVFEGVVRGAAAGADYVYVIDGERERPDPASRSQPQGVHGPSRVVDPSAFAWHDDTWRGVSIDRLVTYELHVGTFTPDGTFAAIIPKLPHLVSLGVTAVELMPVAEFPGGRNWGYDGVHLFAPQSTYGGPDGLRALVDACHAHGLAVILDVVYNHVGPEGNYLEEFAPFFTDAYKTPWGRAINYDGPDSDGVRRHVLTNAAHWFTEYRVDALRLDAIHGIFDHSAHHILSEIPTVRSAALGRRAFIIGESDLNDVRVLRPPELGGYGLDAQWTDDFHHALYTLLADERRGYFEDFGRVGQLAKALTDSFVYDGQYSHHRRRRHGNRAAELPGQQFVVYVQNHDQVANGSQGRRLTTVIGPRAHALAAAVLLTSPYLPLLFMGEEYGERAPFHYFVSHGDPALIEAVRAGRRAELEGLGETEVPDPEAESTFFASQLDWSLVERAEHAQLLALYRELIALRRRLPSLGNCRKDLTRVAWGEAARWLVIERGDPEGELALVVCNFNPAAAQVPVEGPPGSYRLALATDEARFGGAATPPQSELELAAGQAVSLALPEHAARVYVRERR